MLASVATHASRSKIAPAALLELKIACDLFEAASKYGGRAGKFLVRFCLLLTRTKLIAQPSADIETSTDERTESLQGRQQRNASEYSERHIQSLSVWGGER